MIGGPKFVGHALIEAALARGHELTTFNRGQTNPDAFPEIEKLHGDREQDFSALEGRSFDAVVDTSGYAPPAVRNTVEAVDSGRYLFVSSISVYADYREPRVEDDPLEQLAEGHPDDRLLEDYANYGALKALCEAEVQRVFGDRAILVRPGLIVGPNDPTDRFTYWPRRVERGGPMLVPPDQPVQMIDVRDLAAWMLTLVENEESGAFNATSPPRQHTFWSMLADCGATDVVQVSLEFMEAHGIQEWGELPCWISPKSDGFEAFQLVPVDRAIATGLTFRPLAETARDVPEWTGRAGLQPEREAELLAAWEGSGA